MKSKKILMIGNSFSICVGQNLPDIVLASGNSVKLASAYIGGCPLSLHWENIEKADQDPDFKPYDYRIWTVRNGRIVMSEPEKANVNTMLKDDAYDVITIQQASHFSWDPETYQPFADNLIKRIREEQPQAEIMVQQTWSYCCQDARFNGAWNFDQKGMYDRLNDAYGKLAETYGFRRIPTGTAIQIFRERTPEEKRFRKISKAEFAKYRWPDLPSVAGDVVGNIGWYRGEDGNTVIGMDEIHLNKWGEYLQACVWFGAVYGEDPRKITWASRYVSNTDAAFLRECAYEALKQEGLL